MDMGVFRVTDYESDLRFLKWIKSFLGRWLRIRPSILVIRDSGSILAVEELIKLSDLDETRLW